MDGGSPCFIPASTGIPRSDGADALARFVARYNETGSLRPVDYQDVTRNSSYHVALLLAGGYRDRAGRAPTPTPIADEAALEPVAGDSAEQREAEAAMLHVPSRELGATIEKRRLVAESGAWAELGGFSQDPPILVEAWAHQGPPKPAQKAKVMTDALKLARAEATFLPGARKILLFSNEAAAARSGRRGPLGPVPLSLISAWRSESLPFQSRLARPCAGRRNASFAWHWRITGQ